MKRDDLYHEWYWQRRIGRIVCGLSMRFYAFDIGLHWQFLNLLYINIGFITLEFCTTSKYDCKECGTRHYDSDLCKEVENG